MTYPATGSGSLTENGLFHLLNITVYAIIKLTNLNSISTPY